MIRFEHNSGANPPAYRVGDAVDVLYNPQTPQDATIDSWWDIWMPSMIFMGFGGLFTLIGGLSFLDAAGRLLKISGLLALLGIIFLRRRAVSTWYAYRVAAPTMGKRYATWHGTPVGAGLVFAPAGTSMTHPHRSLTMGNDAPQWNGTPVGVGHAPVRRWHRASTRGAPTARRPTARRLAASATQCRG